MFAIPTSLRDRFPAVLLISKDHDPGRSAWVQLGGTAEANLSEDKGELQSRIDLALEITPRAPAIVFDQELASYKTEENVTYSLGKAVTHFPCAIALVKADNLRFFDIVMRLAAAIDLDWKVEAHGAFHVHILRKPFSSEPDPAELARAELDEILDVATCSLSNKSGLSLIRVGHCETRILGWRRYFSRQAVNKTISMQWGDPPISDGDLDSIQRDMRMAVRKADYIGMHPAPHLVQGKNNVLEMASYKVVREALPISHSAKITLANIHKPLGESRRLFSDLMGAAGKVVLITGRSVQSGLEAAAPNFTFFTIAVPPEHKFSNGPHAYHYPNEYSKIMDQIHRTVLPGDLVLVGAGLLGKIYCGAAKDLGAVALDIGSIFDAWVGMKTRGGSALVAPL